MEQSDLKPSGDKNQIKNLALCQEQLDVISIELPENKGEIIDF